MLVYTIFSGDIYDVSVYIQMDFIIKLIVIFSMLAALVFIIIDDYNQNQTMYQRLSVSKTDVFYGKWLSVIFIGAISLIFGIILINVKVAFYLLNDALGFVTSGISSQPLILIDKKWFELLSIPNFFINISIISFIILIVNLKIKYTIQFTNPYEFKYSIPWIVLRVMLLQVVLRLSLIWIEPYFQILNFNSRGHYLIIREQNQFLIINFLFIPSIFFYFCYFLYFKYHMNHLLNKKET
jgi:hypothetical protein